MAGAVDGTGAGAGGSGDGCARGATTLRAGVVLALSP